MKKYLMILLAVVVLLAMSLACDLDPRIPKFTEAPYPITSQVTVDYRATFGVPDVPLVSVTPEGRR